MLQSCGELLQATVEFLGRSSDANVAGNNSNRSRGAVNNEATIMQRSWETGKREG